MQIQKELYFVLYSSETPFFSLYIYNADLQLLIEPSAILMHVFHKINTNYIFLKKNSIISKNKLSEIYKNNLPSKCKNF
jgi:hypothetical protein